MKWHMDWRFFLWSHANKRTNEQTNWTKSCWNCSWRVIATSFVDSSRTSDVYIVTSRSSFSSVPNYWYHQLAGNTGWEIGDLATGCSNSKNWVRPPKSEERERKAAAINWGLWPMLNKLASSNFSLECTLPVLGMLNVPIVSGFRIVGSFSLKELFLQMSNCKANTT